MAVDLKEVAEWYYAEYKRRTEIIRSSEEWNIYWALPDTRISWSETCDRFPDLRNDLVLNRLDLQPLIDVKVRKLKREGLWQ